MGRILGWRVRFTSNDWRYAYLSRCVHFHNACLYLGFLLAILEFFNIKCRESNLKPKCAVIVATVRALKMHGGGPPVLAGKPLAVEYTQENVPLVMAGCANLVKHIQNAKKFGVQVVVAINQFKSDTEEEMETVRRASLEAGAFDAVVSNHWAKGGKGAETLAHAVVAACEVCNNGDFRYLYDLELPIRTKVEIISKEIYGAEGVDFSELAEQQMTQYENAGFGNLPSEFLGDGIAVYIAFTIKTQNNISLPCSS